MRKYIWFVFLFFFIGCYSNYVGDDTNNSMVNLSLIDTTVNIDGLISIIESSKYVERRHIGSTGKESHVYKCYDELLKIASDSLWLELTYSKSAVMRCYAYTALQSKGDSVMIIEVRKRLIKDTANVGLYSCDVILANLTVADWVNYGLTIW